MGQTGLRIESLEKLDALVFDKRAVIVQSTECLDDVRYRPRG